MRKRSISIAFISLALPLMAAQSPLDLVKQVAANYAALSKTSYDFERVEVRKGYGNTIEQRMRIAGSGGKYREESLPNGVLYISDGQFRWTYNPEHNEYTRSNAVRAAPAPNLSMFEIAAYRAKSAQFLRQEEVEMATGKVICDVIEVQKEAKNGSPHYSPTTYWIDATRNLVLKMNYKVSVAQAGAPNPSGSEVTVSFNKAAVGQPVDETLFQFTPPDHAVEVGHLTFGAKSPLIGTESPEFELKSLDGQPITSASLRNNMVLLQFGGSPESSGLAIVEMLYRSLKSKGLIAYYVMPMKLPPGKASQNYSVPVAIDADHAVAARFEAGLTGTVLIDREGKVVYADSTSSNWLGLSNALQEAGVW